MPVDITKALAKLDRPPSGPNWVRFVQDDRPLTTRAILNFVKGMPRFTYLTGLTAIRDHFLLGISEDTAVKLTAGAGAPAGRQQNRELVEAFFAHSKSRGYPTGTSIDFERQWFRISRELAVPVSPLVIIREHGRFVPIFVCGWSDLALDEGQRRLLMTIYEDAFLSLTDYQTSPAEFLFFPKVASNGKKEREAEIWRRGDYALLSAAQLDEQVHCYLEAREEVRGILLTAKAAEERRRSEESMRDESQDSDSADDLFGVRPRK